ncbi:GMC oxidoreductase [Macroventuria anomochaeta]|uniref:GMC oxidoreductase n=1 Tax=Macroventuria anomochaeta TaxID=301207 RepID=A0ACB6RXZ2_9PLEO|nr:GMC oxidoreductase [Macroventuria anomochaeta]KAF2626643.1 GMC oxidoreductase [Macroventuria anomochaeta]
MMLNSLPLLSTAQLVLAACDPSTTFDYVIVGGGTAGLVLANRLSANPATTVAVIEAGDLAYSNPNVTYVPKSIAEFALGLGTSVEWGYTTEPQRYTANGNVTLPYWAGKGVGGTTLVNGMTYVRAEKRQIDAWEDLGNEGWNWETMKEYYVEQENFSRPSEQQEANGATYDESAHEYEGELDVGFTPYLTGQGAFDVLRQTHEAKGYAWNKDVNTGSMHGFNVWPMTLNVSTLMREDAARAFYYPIAKERPNLHVFLNTTASHILWKDSDGGSEKTTSGVEVVRSDGTIRTLQATREVILSAGSIRSPALLELSGIGNPSVLKPLGIETIVPLPSVGSNLQDQPANGIIYSSSTNWTGYATFASFLTASDLFGASLPSIIASIASNLTSYAHAILSDFAPNSTTLAIQEQLLRHQLDLVFAPTSTVPLAEILWVPTGNLIVAQFWNLLPFSKGSIHINSTNPLSQPSINPNFLQLPIDTLVQAAIAVHIRELFATPPLAEYVTDEVTPGFAVVLQDATYTDEAWIKWVKGSFNGNSHPVTTCGMMARELGGVVDAEGRVYGTRNVRVVDASVFPTQISGHLSASVYALSGKIADAILKNEGREQVEDVHVAPPHVGCGERSS